MDYPELIAEVIEIVKRPDLAARISSAVQSATLKAHHSDFYYRDLRESGVVFDSERFVQNFDPRDIFPKFRKAKYLRFWRDVAPTGPSQEGLGAGAFLTPVMIENAQDSYRTDRVNVYYMAGDLLQIRVSHPWKHFLFGAYVHPTVTQDGFSSWIAEEYPWAIIYEACRSVFQAIGFQEQSSEMRLQVAEQYQMLKVNSVGMPGE